MMQEFASWFLGVVKNFFKALWQFFLDIFVGIADVVLGVIGDVIKSIPAPDFLSQYSLNGLIAGIDPGILYYASGLKLGECFAVLGLGFAFRMVRKMVTLGQW